MNKKLKFKKLYSCWVAEGISLYIITESKFGFIVENPWECFSTEPLDNLMEAKKYCQYKDNELVKNKNNWRFCDAI